MWSNVDGTANVAIGNGALYSNIAAYSNTAVGFDALHNDSASENTAIGYQAMYSNTTGVANVAMGQTALRENISGSYNTAVGWDAMKTASGYHNSAFGMSALKFNATGNGNVAVGSDALVACLDGSNNTMVGTQADFLAGGATDITNSTAIGYDAKATAGNQVRLGNNDIQSLYCMGAYNATIENESPNLFVTSDGQILRISAPILGAGYAPLKLVVTAFVGTVPAGNSRKVLLDAEGSIQGKTVFVSPAVELPDGLVIAYARVSAPGVVEVKFTNTTVQEVVAGEMEYIVTVFN